MMKVRYVVSVLSLLGLSTFAAINAHAETRDAANNVTVSVASGSYLFTSTVCNFTSDVPQLDAVSADGTRVTVFGPSSELHVDGPTLSYDGIVDFSKGDSTSFALGGHEVDGSRTFFVQANCK